MMRKNHLHRVDESDAGMRLDALMGALAGVPSRSAAVRLIESGDVTVNGEVESKSYIVACDDMIEFVTTEQVVSMHIGEYIPLDIRFEDEHLIVLSKQADLVCHPSRGHETGTLVNALIAHCGIEHLGMLQGDERPGIVHRLDKDTTGLMLVAKTDAVQESLQDAIRLRSVDRRYLTLVHGNIAPDTGLIDAPIARASRERMRMEISDSLTARPSVTTFSVLERFDAGRFDEGYSLLECKLYTGRTHQIRVHMDYIHHPCVGDQLYGACKAKADLGLMRQFLHSYRLEFDHPVTQEHLSFTDPLPEDLCDPLAQIANTSAGRTEMGEKVLPLIC